MYTLVVALGRQQGCQIHSSAWLATSALKWENCKFIWVGQYYYYYNKTHMKTTIGSLAHGRQTNFETFILLFELELVKF